jgi:anti-sigma B factor antagonist
MTTGGSGSPGTEALVVVVGELTRSVLPQWRTAIERVLETRPSRLVVDLSQARTIDTDGIIVLLNAHRRLVNAGGQLVVRSPGERIRRLFGLARVGGVLTIEAGPQGASTADPVGDSQVAAAAPDAS